MKMVINYNMGVEKEHMKLTESAGEYYKMGRKLAVAINNPYMIKKFDGILSKIGSVRWSHFTTLINHLSYLVYDSMNKVFEL